MAPEISRRDLFRRSAASVAAVSIGSNPLLDSMLGSTGPSGLSALSLTELKETLDSATVASEKQWWLGWLQTEWKRGYDVREQVGGHHNPVVVEEIRSDPELQLLLVPKDPEKFGALHRYFTKTDAEADKAREMRSKVLRELERRNLSPDEAKFVFSLKFDLNQTQGKLDKQFVNSFIQEQLQRVDSEERRQRNVLSQSFSEFKHHYLNGTLDEWSDNHWKRCTNDLIHDQWREDRILDNAGPKYRHSRSLEETVARRQKKASHRLIQTLERSKYTTERISYGERLGLDEYIIYANAYRSTMNDPSEKLTNMIIAVAPEAYVNAAIEPDSESDLKVRILWRIHPRNFALREVLEAAVRGEWDKASRASLP